jgi:hypothetical protein
MKPWKVATVAVLVAVVAAAIVGQPYAEDWLARRIRAAIENGGQVSVARVEVGLFERRLTISDIHSTRQGDLTAKRWQATGLGVPLGDLVRGRVRLFAFRPGDPLYADRVVLEDARFSDGVTGAGWTIGSLTMEGVDLERYDATASGPFQFPARVARLGLALSIRHLEETKVVYTLAGMPATIAIDAMMLDGLEHGRIGKVGFIGLAVRPRGADAPSVKAAEAGASGLDLGPLLTTFSSPTWSPGQPIGRVSVDQASASGFSGDSFARYGMALDSVSLDTSHEGDISRSRTRVTGFSIAPPFGRRELQGLSSTLAAMKLKALQLELDCTGSVEKPKGEFGVDRCQLVGADLGTLDFTARFVGADQALWQALERGNYFALSRSKVALASAKMALADKGILQHLAQAVAADSGQPLPSVRAALADQVRHYQPAGVLITDQLTKLLDTVAQFMEKGGTLAIELKPDPPIELTSPSLNRPGPDLVELLGASATLSK